MIEATKKDKSKIIEILSVAFDENASVNYIVKQDTKRRQRLVALMDYSFELCWRFGKVYLSDDHNACALVFFPDRKKTSVWAMWQDVKLVFEVTGLSGLSKALKRESRIKAVQPQSDFYYLWFIAVKPECQNRGKGTDLLKAVVRDARELNRPVYLETSTIVNLPWYKKQGFEIYHELMLSYVIYFLKLDK